MGCADRMMTQVYQGYKRENAHKEDAYKRILGLNCHADSQEFSADFLNDVVTVFRIDLYANKKFIMSTLLSEVHHFVHC